MISIITPTTRPEGIRVVFEALKKQSFKNWEWLMVLPESGFEKFRDAFEIKDGFRSNRVRIGDREIYLVFEPPAKKGDFWNLNKAYNEGIRTARGELIVSWQDHTYAKYDTLERFWGCYEAEPKMIVGAVGNKYTSVYPEIGAMTWKDPRERDDQGSYYLTGYENIEWNLCSVPKMALYDIGGFDEKLDSLGYGMDGYSVNERIAMLGTYDFKLNQSIKSYSEEHGRKADWEEHNNIHGNYQARRLDYINNGPLLPYLKNMGFKKGLDTLSKSGATMAS